MNRLPSLITVVAIGWVVLGVSGCQRGAKHAEAVAEANERWQAVRSSSMLRIAQQQFDAGDLDQAEDSLLAALSDNPENPYLMVLAGRVALERGQLERAFQRLDQAIDQKDDIGEAHYFQGIIQQRWSRSEGALESYSRAYEIQPDHVSYLLALGETLVTLGRLDEAETLLTDKVNYFDQNAGVRMAMGHVHALKGEHGKAAYFYQQASLLVPEDMHFMEQLATAQMNAKQIGEAVDSLEQLVLHPGNADRRDLNVMLAQGYTELGQPARARRIYRKLTRRDATDGEAWVRLGELAWAEGDSDGAMMASRRARAAEPDRYEGYLLAGMVLQNQQKSKDAVEMYGRAAELAPESALPLILKGITLEQAGRQADAAAAYTEALGREPNESRAQRLLANVSVDIGSH